MKNSEYALRMWPSEKLVDPFNLRNDEIELVDIAHALSRICRYGGKVEGFMSVAEHSIIVAQILVDDGHTDEVIRCGLMHDAAETYLTDMPRPIKYRPEMAPFRAAEQRADEVIAVRFDLPWPFHPAVKEADTMAFEYEIGPDPTTGAPPLRARSLEDSPNPNDVRDEFLDMASALGIT